jgi:membrane complex biogenesis BtpA family protein
VERIDLRTIFPAPRPIIGMLHAPPLPGAPRWQPPFSRVVEHVLGDASALQQAGVDGVLLENFGDVPFYGEQVPPETVAALALLAHEVRTAVNLPLGVNVLRNDAAAALAIAAVTGAAFIRVNVHVGVMLTDQGQLQGRAADTLRRRVALGMPIAILADVLVKHAVAPAGLTAADAARDTWYRGLADALVVTGAATGSAADLARIHEVRTAVPGAPVLVGSGVNADSVAALLPHTDGAIIGSAFEHGGRAGAGVDAERARRLMKQVRSLG